MSRQATISNLKDSLREFIASLDGERNADTSPAVRDTPGARVADEATKPAANTGQDITGRRRHLPAELAAAAAQADRLLGTLDRLESVGPNLDSPGMRTARNGGGTRADIGSKIRRNLGVGGR